MAGGKKDVYDATTGAVVVSGVSEPQAKKIVDNMPTSHDVKIRPAAEESAD